MKKINIALVGLGQIGNYLLNELNKKKRDIEIKTGKKINIVAISAKNINKKRKFRINKKIFYKNPLNILKIQKVDILFECIGLSDGISKKLVETALKNKVHVITPNKALISKHGDYLSKLAEKNKVNLEFEASVAGGIPILRTIKEGLATNKINKVYGILNGTCNYILTEMRETGRSFEDVLQEAQSKGYAEADPTFDVDGIDAAQKLTLLTAIAFGIAPNDKSLNISGIRDVDVTDILFAEELGYRIKLLATSKFDGNGLVQEVSPCMISLDKQISNIEGVLNAVQLDTQLAGSVMLSGFGAGAEPTATAVLSDIITVAQGKAPNSFGCSARELIVNIKEGKNDNHRFYIRVNVIDKSGVLANITEIFRKYKLSIESLLQRGRKPNEEVPVVITTHETDDGTLMSVMNELNASKELLNKPVCMKII